MAITIPIISEFNAKGVRKAVKEFQQLEGTVAKTRFAFKKMAVPAAAAFSGIAAAAVAFGKAAADDQLAADQLALALRNNTKATDAAIKANEDFIATVSMQAAVADDDLRPALQKLAVGTKDLGKAQQLLQTALNVSAATGLDLSTVSDALAKGYNGNTKALAKLSPQLKKMIKDGSSFADVVKVLDNQFKGASKTFATSAAGSMKKLSITIDETKESIGAALLPVIQAVLPYLQKFAEWAQKNPTTFKIIAIAIAAVAASIMAVNFAMALNPFTAAIAGIGLLVAAVMVAWNKFTWFRDGVKAVWSAISGYVTTEINTIIKNINLLITGLNAVSPFKDIPYIPLLGAQKAGTATNPFMPRFEGAGPASAFGFAPRITAPQFAGAGPASAAGITINVYGGDPNAVVQTLRKYNRQTGSLPVRTKVIG